MIDPDVIFRFIAPGEENRLSSGKDHNIVGIPRNMAAVENVENEGGSHNAQGFPGF
jgi:hypothetical protein